MKTLIALNIMLLGLIGSPSFADNIDGTHVPMTKEDSSAIDALVLYPDSVRLDIFKACEYPAVIVNVASIQKNSSATFAEMVSGYTKEEQEDIWNMSRYPGLITELAHANGTSDNTLNAIAANYPEDIRATAVKYGKSDQALLIRIDSLQTSTNTQFNQSISYYPADVQATFQRLLQYPEVLNLLNDHLSLTVRVGDHYKRDPQYVIHKADSNAAAQAKESTQEVEDWKQNINSDTAAQNELKSAANAYADSNGYTTSQVDAPRDTTDVNNYNCQPYSYWFGYPTWYPYAYWYPYPYWYDWGFYYGPYGNLVVFGMPSFYFTNWYFYYPWYWHRYPHLGGCYVNHFYGHRRSYSRSAMVVHSWVQNNRGYLPKDFMTSRTSRVEAIRQLGDLHEEVRKEGPVNNVTRNNYLQAHPDKFTVLNHTPQQVAAPIKAERVTNVIQQPVRQPAVVPSRINNTMPQRTTPTYTQPQRTAPTYTQPQRTQPSFNNVYKAQNYQRAQWENTQPTYHPAPSPAPARSYSAPAPSRSGGGGGRR
jgi:hypothetical protein